MLESVANYLGERRRGLTKSVSYVGAGYLVLQYMRERVEDIRTRVGQDRIARENLRKRFDQNQEDIAFTIMALLPTLGEHILEGMDVEGVTQELQSLSKSGTSSKVPPATLDFQPPVPLSDSSITSSMIHIHERDAEARSESGSVSSASAAQEGSDLAASSTSWVGQFSSVQSSQVSVGALHHLDPPERTQSPQSNVGTDMSESITSASSQSSGAQVPAKVSPPESTLSDATSLTRSKAELWREVKMLTFTRTLTILYSVTLLSLFTHIQLSVIGRSRYIQFILQQEEDERMREELADRLSIYSLFWGDNAADEQDDAPRLCEEEYIEPDTEMKYLTLSWWVLHVGWKDVGERVRRAVEEVFEGVSLKAKLTVVDVHRLVEDVRRRVEYEVTFEGKERRINFLSTLLPPTPETLQHVLTQGGISPRAATARDARFHQLVAETRTHLQSASCERVLEVCLDRATDVLDAGVRQHVFGGADATSSERLAGMLPGLARWCHGALEGLPNALVDALAGTREMEVFSAIIYSDYEKRLV